MKIRSKTVRVTLLVSVLANILLMSTAINAGQADVPKDTHTSLDELQWGPTPFGPEAAVVSGDFSAGKHITYIKFAAGMKTPLHIHSNNYIGLVMSGTTKHWIPNEPNTQKLLPAGSHWSIAANVEHVSECLPGDDCVMAIFQEQAFDFIPTVNQ